MEMSLSLRTGSGGVSRGWVIGTSVTSTAMVFLTKSIFILRWRGVDSPIEVRARASEVVPRARGTDDIQLLDSRIREGHEESWDRD